MKRAISEIAGRAVADAGCGQAPVEIYRALRPLRCASCDRLMVEGELFTRRATSAQGLRILPRCRTCAPFALQPEEASTGHPMLDSLLSAASETSPVSKRRGAQEEELSSTNAPPDDEKQRRLTQAMIERLGPALRHARRHRT
ncbi:MAG TPA: hypothetical protein VF708_04775 [Pyrinomonadaceae bacterium]